MAVILKSTTIGTSVALNGSVNTNYFISDGASSDWDNTIGRPAVYDAATNKTWFFWEGWSNAGNGNKRVVEVCVFDHTNSEWTSPVIAGSRTLLGDQHGMPTTTNPHPSGWFYALYGTHVATDLKITHNTVANDPNIWNDTTTFTVASYGKITFPRGFVIGNNIYIMYCSGGVGIGDEESIAVTVASIDPSTGNITGSGTFSHLFDCASVGVDGWLIPGTFLDIGNGKIAMSWCYGTFIGHYPTSNMYYGVYDTTIGVISNFDGSFIVIPSNQPVNKATMDAHFIAWSGLTDTVPGMIVDDAGATHMVFANVGVSPSTLLHIVNSGSGWSTPHTLYTFPLALGINPGNAGVCKSSSGGVAVYWPDGSLLADTLYAAGSGNMIMAIRSTSGVWSTNTQVLAYTNYGLYNPVSVINGSVYARLVFTEVSSDGLTIAGNLKAYAVGDIGFLPR